MSAFSLDNGFGYCLQACHYSGTKFWDFQSKSGAEVLELEARHVKVYIGQRAYLSCQRWREGM